MHTLRFQDPVHTFRRARGAYLSADTRIEDRGSKSPRYTRIEEFDVHTSLLPQGVATTRIEDRKARGVYLYAVTAIEAKGIMQKALEKRHRTEGVTSYKFILRKHFLACLPPYSLLLIRSFAPSKV